MSSSPSPTADRVGFDPDRRWRRSPKVGLRPEPFGALAYHFDTRRLVFLKSPGLVTLVDGLGDHPSAGAAIAAIIEPADERTTRSHIKALATLAEAGVVEPVTEAAPADPDAPAATEPPTSPPISFVG